MNFPEELFGEIGQHLDPKEFEKLSFHSEYRELNGFRCLIQERLLEKYGLNTRDLLVRISHNRQIIDEIIQETLEEYDIKIVMDEEIYKYFYEMYQFDKNWKFTKTIILYTMREALSMAYSDSLDYGQNGETIYPEEIQVYLSDIENQTYSETIPSDTYNYFSFTKPSEIGFH